MLLLLDVDGDNEDILKMMMMVPGWATPILEARREIPCN